jgi:hypothetical protein
MVGDVLSVELSPDTAAFVTRPDNVATVVVPDRETAVAMLRAD